MLRFRDKDKLFSYSKRQSKSFTWSVLSIKSLKKQKTEESAACRTKQLKKNGKFHGNVEEIVSNNGLQQTFCSCCSSHISDLPVGLDECLQS